MSLGVFVSASRGGFSTFYKQTQTRTIATFFSSDLVCSVNEVKSHLARWNFLRNKYLHYDFVVKKGSVPKFACATDLTLSAKIKALELTDLTCFRLGKQSCLYLWDLSDAVFLRSHPPTELQEGNQGRIQDFRRRGHLPPLPPHSRGRQDMILPNISEKLHEIDKILGRRSANGNVFSHAVSLSVHGEGGGGGGVGQMWSLLTVHWTSLYGTSHQYWHSLVAEACTIGNHPTGMLSCWKCTQSCQWSLENVLSSGNKNQFRHSNQNGWAPLHTKHYLFSYFYHFSIFYLSILKETRFKVNRISNNV